jgi:uncharacterized membrane protein YeaQ/YmgE (transglycosylase-associated protein family)
MAISDARSLEVTGLNLWSLLVAVIGAVIVLVIYRLIASGGRLAPPRTGI